MEPILFNTEMVRAIMGGHKTMTRRIIKPQPSATAFVQKQGASWCWAWRPDCDEKRLMKLPYRPGDIIYVREAWTKENGEFFYRADFDSDFLGPCETLSGGYPFECTYYPGCDGCTRGKRRILWHPSIHMPKEAAHLFLRVKDVRAEQLRAITREDATAEGAKGPYDYQKSGWYEQHRLINEYEIAAFAGLWDSTVKPADLPRFGWDANPWVWVIEFERIEKDAALGDEQK